MSAIRRPGHVSFVVEYGDTKLVLGIEVEFTYDVLTFELRIFFEIRRHRDQWILIDPIAATS